MDTITRADLIAKGGDPKATHAVFDAVGDLYFCINSIRMDEQAEVYFWESRQCKFVKVEE